MDLFSETPTAITHAGPSTSEHNREVYGRLLGLDEQELAELARHQITHLSHRVSGVNVVAPGQSGDPASPHFADQLELYSTWHYKPMRLNLRDLIGHIESIEVLVTR